MKNEDDACVFMKWAQKAIKLKKKRKTQLNFYFYWGNAMKFWILLMELQKLKILQKLQVIKLMQSKKCNDGHFFNFTNIFNHAVSKHGETCVTWTTGLSTWLWE